jgi:hypothetical protein
MANPATHPTEVAWGIPLTITPSRLIRLIQSLLTTTMAEVLVGRTVSQETTDCLARTVLQALILCPARTVLLPTTVCQGRAVFPVPTVCLGGIALTGGTVCMVVTMY